MLRGVYSVPDSVERQFADPFGQILFDSAVQYAIKVFLIHFGAFVKEEITLVMLFQCRGYSLIGEGLEQIIHSAELQTFLYDPLFFCRGHKDHIDICMFAADLPQHFYAVHSRHNSSAQE